MPELLQAEQPVLSFARVGVALHFVETTALAVDADRKYPDCPVLRSMELDLLSYRFQLRRPIGSQCESHRLLPVTLLYPATVQYLSEGRRVSLACAEPCKPAQLIISSTQFLQSGIRVWHVVVVPAPEDRFTEFDLIKLIHLYDGRTEDTRLRETLRFQFPDGRTVGVAELPNAAHPSLVGNAQLRAGTIQILAEDLTPSGATFSELLGLLDQDASPEAPAAEPRKYWQEDLRSLAAYAGIVSGIFDFEEMDVDEIRDVLVPTVRETDGLVRLHRCTLTSISGSDRAMEACWETVGVSPYLLLPHAVVLHNEALVDAAEAELASVYSGRRFPLRRLEQVHDRADRILNRFYLPNIFNYQTERLLFRRSTEERGADEARAAALVSLGELEHRIQSAWEERRDRGQMCIAVLLALISLLQTRDVVFATIGSGPEELLGWEAVGLVGLAFTALIVFFWRLGYRRQA